MEDTSLAKQMVALCEQTQATGKLLYEANVVLLAGFQKILTILESKSMTANIEICETIVTTLADVHELQKKFPHEI